MTAFEPPPGPPTYGSSPGQYGQPLPPGQPYGPPPEDNVWSVLVHLSYFVFSLLAPLVLYLVVKNDPRKPMTRHHAAEALNFHLTLFLAFAASVVLFLPGMILPSLGLVVLAVLLLVVVYVAGAVLSIVAAVAAGSRKPYRYPMTIRFVR